MKLPKQVQEAEERANKAIEEANKPAVAPQDPPQGDPPVDVKNDPPPAADPPPAESGKDGQDRQDWKAKYHTLQGMFNAEVPRLHRDLKAANERIESLAVELADVRAKATTSAPPPAAEPMKITAPAELVAALGQEGADALMATIKEEAKGIRADVGKEIAPVAERAEAATKTTEQLAQDRAADKRNAFMHALKVRLPDWETIDADERWHVFLAEKDRFARRPRQELIAEAYRDGDLDSVVAFFEAFKDANGLSKPADPPPNPNADALARQLVPDPSGRSSAPQEKKQWTRAEVVDVYKQIALGKVSPEKAAALEQDIVAAAGEGRIR